MRCRAPRRTRGPVAAVLVAAAIGLFAHRPLAAQEFADRGVFVLERNGAEAGRVEFAVRRTGGSQGRTGLLLIAATHTPAHEIEVALELSKDTVPITFQQTETVGGRVVRRVSAALSGRRFSARASSAETEVARELPVEPPILILADEDYTSYVFLPRPDSGQARSVSVIRAKDLTVSQAVVQGTGSDKVRAFGRNLACQRYVLRLPEGEERQFWIAPGGALARVVLPGSGLTAARSEP